MQMIGTDLSYIRGSKVSKDRFLDRKRLISPNTYLVGSKVLFWISSSITEAGLFACS